MRKHIHSVRWLSVSSEGKSSASFAGLRPASETSEGIVGTSGTGGKRNAKNERPNGRGLSLQYVNTATRKGILAHALLLDEPFAKTVYLAETGSYGGEYELRTYEHAQCERWSSRTHPEHKTYYTRRDDRGYEAN